MPTVSADSARQFAARLGFTGVGIIPAAPSPRLDAYHHWIAAGMHGSMGYLARPDRVQRRADLNVILPGVRSLVIVALDYGTITTASPRQADSPPLTVVERGLGGEARGRISNYAWGADYHTIMLPRLEQIAAWLREQSGNDVISRAYVDTGAILERSHAQQAGLGFVGKNTMLIHPRRGSYFFLGEVLTTLTFEDYDQPHRETMCGTCTRCLSACPTGAFPQPYVLDARRCISYLTIEHKGSIPVELRPLMGNWVYGCDICQAVCPFTRFVQLSAEAAFWSQDADRAAPLLADLLALDEAGFRARYAGSAVERIKRERLVRNACIAAGNSGLPDLLPLLERLAQEDESALVREHAAWGQGRINGL
ncbi:MAG: tRNA epoxyqueuosine(34) reductase QueG [Chloroflexi bacterium]|nr:tRNA epoxyqueuosine(34) reductase QueG [Chloroflexota bacterium]